MKKTHVVIIGAGPAGLTAAYELALSKKYQITILDYDKQVGGISKTINHNGNRIDIGGHRFFSKSDWVMNWWAQFLPIVSNKKNAFLKYQGKTKKLKIPNNIEKNKDNVMLVRNRISRIYFNKNFFSYPLKLNIDTALKLGFFKSFFFGISYLKSMLFPIKPEKSLEDFFINRFGRLLYLQFFKSYTEKVWGEKCCEISADWGAQRIKGLSISKALIHYIKGFFVKSRKVEQTSLIEEFIYPKFGPGQMWEVVAERVKAMGVKIYLESRVNNIEIKKNQVSSISYNKKTMKCDYLLSTMPIKDLFEASKNSWSIKAYKIATNLQYRDFITVGILLDKKNLTRNLIDNWIYIQEPGVNVGRIQVFNNWSPYLVKNKKTIWLGLEFFCKEEDSLWSMKDKELINLSVKELQQIKLINNKSIADSIVVRVPKAYPGYFGKSFKNFKLVQQEINQVKNLFLIGRNGMHRYNNQDHSMLTAKAAADQIINNNTDKSTIWKINIDDEYHEEK
jgi:protoporphyrinogen oxidase